MNIYIYNEYVCICTYIMHMYEYTDIGLSLHSLGYKFTGYIRDVLRLRTPDTLPCLLQVSRDT